MTMLPIAAQMPFGAYIPLVLLVVAYAALNLLANRASSNDDRAQADRFGNLGFGVALLSAAYAVILLIATIVGYPSRFYDMVIIVVVIAVFFVLLLFAFFVIAEVIPGALRRNRDR
jgi:cell division protein FtsW (lipid II flippase)